MAQVWNALNSLSRTMRDRGGVTDAQIRGIDATTGLKRAEYEIGRGVEADRQAKELFGMRKEAFTAGAPGRELQTEKDKAALAEEQRLNELVPIHVGFVHPGKGEVLVGELTGDSDDHDNNTFSIKEQMVEGSGYDNEGFRTKIDGSRVMVPRRKLEQDYGPALTAINAVRNDPAYHLSDKLHNMDQKLSQLVPGTPEYIQGKKDRDSLKAISDDPVQMAGFYANQIMVGHEGIALALARKANPEMIKQLEKAIGRSEKKFEEYKGRVPTEESRLKLDDMRQKIEASKAAIEASKAKQKKYEAETGKLKPSEQLAREKRNIENFSGKYRITKDTISGFLTSPEYTESQRKAIEKDAEGKGVGVGFEPIVTPGEKNYFSPDKPDTTTYRINSVWGLGESGTGSRQGLGQPGATGFGARTDGTPKGNGWLGVLKRPDGKVSTELSVSVNFDGKETLIPLLVPGLTEKEVNFLLKSEPSPEILKTPEGKAIFEKAKAHALEMLRAGKSPFKEEGTAGLGGHPGTAQPTAPAGVPAPPQGFVLDSAEGNQPVAPAQISRPQTAGLGNVPAVQPQQNIAGLGYEGMQPAPTSPSPELIPGMGGNINALNRSLEEAARAMGMQTKEEAAQVLADFAGVPVENVNSMPPNKLAELVNAVIASQKEAQKTVGNIQPYGIR
uniref:Uncharacterized protein n=1 Tax=viral metagenome TaxID=1070528 RepID=A0A6M3JDB3_9ZZZZ